MKRDMVDLKKLVLDIYQNQGKGNQVIKDNPELFNGLESNTPASLTSDSVVLNLPSDGGDEDVEDVHDISHETEDESLSIGRKERELIIRALQKNNNKQLRILKRLWFLFFLIGLFFLQHFCR